MTALAATAALLLTPVGIGIFRYLAFHVDIHALHPVDEFRAPELASDAPLLLYLALASTALLAFPRRDRLSLRDLLPLLALGLLAARSVRFGADFVLLSSPLLAARATSLLAGTRPARWLAARTWRTPLLVGAATLALLLTVTALRFWQARPDATGRGAGCSTWAWRTTWCPRPL